MKQYLIRTLLLFVPILLLSLSSCKKQVAGPKGDTGENGKKGNVIQSDRTFTIYPASWTFDSSKYSALAYFPEINNDVLTKGDIEIYMKVGTQWWNLPYGVGDVFMRYSIDLQYIHFEYYKIHGVPTASPGEVTFRVVTFAPVN